MDATTLLLKELLGESDAQTGYYDCANKFQKFDGSESGDFVGTRRHHGQYSKLSRVRC